MEISPKVTASFCETYDFAIHSFATADCDIIARHNIALTTQAYNRIFVRPQYELSGAGGISDVFRLPERPRN